MLTVKTGLETMGKINEYVDNQLEIHNIPMKVGFKLRVVIDEIYSNIVFYSGSSETGMDLYVEENKLHLNFSDDGTPYNPLNAKEPDIHAPAEDRDIGGLGVFLVRQLMDEVNYTYEDGKNVLKMMLCL